MTRVAASFALPGGRRGAVDAGMTSVARSPGPGAVRASGQGRLNSDKAALSSVCHFQSKSGGRTRLGSPAGHSWVARGAWLIRLAVNS